MNIRGCQLQVTACSARVKDALQLLIRYEQIRFAQVPERVLTQGFVVLIIGNSKSSHLGAQSTFKGLTPNLNPSLSVADGL